MPEASKRPSVVRGHHPADTTRQCREVLHQLMCAPCSPAQEEVFLREHFAGFPVAVLRTCETFCDKLYDACASASLVLAGNRPADRVDALFSGGLSFCRAVGLRAVETDDHAACFSAASLGRFSGGTSVTAKLLLAAASSVLLVVWAGTSGSQSVACR